jgi:phosphate transport system substrate-binding protein
MHKVQDKPAQASAALKFFNWAYDQGDKTASELDYVPMPKAVKELVRKQWAGMKDTTGAAISMK